MPPPYLSSARMIACTHSQFSGPLGLDFDRTRHRPGHRLPHLLGEVLQQLQPERPEARLSAGLPRVCISDDNGISYWLAKLSLQDVAVVRKRNVKVVRQRTSNLLCASVQSIDPFACNSWGSWRCCPRPWISTKRNGVLAPAFKMPFAAATEPKRTCRTTLLSKISSPPLHFSCSRAMR